MQPRFRPLGLTLAILAAFLIFGFFPVVPALFVGLLYLEKHPLIPGDAGFWLPVLAGVLVMIVCILAWIGRPTWIRIAFQASVLLAGAASLYTLIRPGSLNFSFGFSGGSLDDIFRNVSLCLIPVRLLVLIYTLWYVNRAPARAYYD